VSEPSGVYYPGLILYFGLQMLVATYAHRMVLDFKTRNKWKVQHGRTTVVAGDRLLGMKLCYYKIAIMV
jgi:hypothetical protein